MQRPQAKRSPNGTNLYKQSWECPPWQYWTPERTLAAHKEYVEGKRIPVIAREHGKSINAVYKAFYRMNLPRVKPRIWNEEEIRAAWEKYCRPGATLASVGLEYGLTPQRMQSLFSRHPVICSDGRQIGRVKVGHECVWNEGVCVVCDVARVA